MRAQHFRSAGLVAMSYTMVLLAAEFHASSAVRDCIPTFIADGDCDDINNTMECGFDGGDCCEESCVSQGYICGGNSGFDCLDRDYPDTSYSYDFGCDRRRVGNGYCDPGNNHEGCGFDGGDCCPCTCPRLPASPCGGQDGWTCEDPAAPCLDFYIEAGSVTTVTARANAFDERLGAVGGDEGCRSGGCRAMLTRDKNVSYDESRWTCNRSMVPGEKECAITFSFEEALEIEYVQVAFSEPDENPRTLKVRSNGVNMGQLKSSTASTYTAFPLPGDAVETLTLTSTGLPLDSMISLLEVRFMLHGKNYFYGDGR